MIQRIVVIVTLVIIQSSVSFGFVEKQTFRSCEWHNCGVNCLYMEFPVSFRDTLSSVYVDSVWVTVSGTSNKGFQTLCQGSDCTTVECWDGLLVSFGGDTDVTHCDPVYFSPDGIVDYVAGAYTPVGDGIPFEVLLPLSGIERTGCCEVAYQVIEQTPSFEGVFSQEQVSLRIWRVHGGPMGSGGCYRCMDGLAEIDSVTVNIAYGGELPAAIASWGAVKSLYR